MATTTTCDGALTLLNWARQSRYFQQGKSHDNLVAAVYEWWLSAAPPNASISREFHLCESCNQEVLDQLLTLANGHDGSKYAYKITIARL